MGVSALSLSVLITPPVRSLSLHLSCNIRTSLLLLSAALWLLSLVGLVTINQQMGLVQVRLKKGSNQIVRI